MVKVLNSLFFLAQKHELIATEASTFNLPPQQAAMLSAQINLSFEQLLDTMNQIPKDKVLQQQIMMQIQNLKPSEQISVLTSLLEKIPADQQGQIKEQIEKLRLIPDPVNQPSISPSAVVTGNHQGPAKMEKPSNLTMEK